MTKKDILSFLSENKQKFRNQYGITKIGLFGSFSTGKETLESDIDILVEMEKDMKNIHTFLSLKRELEKAFGISVDLGTESAIKSAVKKEILSSVIYV